MRDVIQKARQYLSEMLDESIEFEKAEYPALPLHLRRRYSFAKVKLLGKTWTFAGEGEEWDTGTPSEYSRQAEILSSHADAPVVLILRDITSTMRTRLVRLNVPFIVPKTQIFLPMAYVSLAERKLKPVARPGKNLTPTAQLLVLYEIIRGGLSDLPSKEIATKLKCSRPMLTKVKGELESRQICRVQRVGKETRMQFDADPRSIWQIALPSLTSPVTKTRWVRWDAPVSRAKRAGLTALSDLTLISDSTAPTFAIHNARFTSLLESGKLRNWPDRNGAHAAVQCWSYDAALLSDGPEVDPLSLYLSLRDEHNERVQGELESLLEAFPWR